MGRSKKKAKASLHYESEGDSLDNKEEEEGGQQQQQAPDVEEGGQSAEVEEVPIEGETVRKKKEYHGNKLAKNQGSKAKNNKTDKAKKSDSGQGKADEAPKNPAGEEETVDHPGGDEALGEQFDEKLGVSLYEPVEVLYCPICTFPAEMCEYSGMYEQCRPWLLEHAKELAEAEERGRKRRVLTERERLERLVKGCGSKKGIERVVHIEVAQRKGKVTTAVRGMDLFGYNLKDLSREWKKMFSSGAGVTKSEELKQDIISVQGDVVERLVELLPEKYSIPKDAIYKICDKKKVRCYND